MAGFGKWLDTFLGEKGIDLETCFEIEGPEGWNLFTVGALVELMKSAPAHEQKGIKMMLVKIDFVNGSVLDYFKHLAKAVAK